MPWWLFSTQADCDAANDAATDLLPPDRSLATGADAAVPITLRWADPRHLTDGRWAIPAYPDIATPSAATLIADSDITTLFPILDPTTETVS